jgi:hypothetical protein
MRRDGEAATTMEQTLAALRSAGIASGMDVARFRDACLAEWRAEQAARHGAGAATVEVFDGDTLLAALSSLYGAHGLTDASAAEGIFAVDEREERAPEVRRRVQALLVQWLGRALPARVTGKLDRMLSYAGDALFLGRHTAGPHAPVLFASDGERATDGLVFTVYVLPRDQDALSAVPVGLWPRVSPDTEAAASGIFRIDGCEPAFAEHAPTCAVCQANLAAVARANRLPPDFAALVVP